MVSQLDCVPQEDGHTDVVLTAHWQCVGTDPNGKHNTAQDGALIEIPVISCVYGATTFTYDPQSPFTPYQDLTQEQVLNWCWNGGVDKEATEAEVQLQIQEQINPPLVTPPLPWAPQGETNV